MYYRYYNVLKIAPIKNNQHRGILGAMEKAGGVGGSSMISFGYRFVRPANRAQRSMQGGGTSCCSSLEATPGYPVPPPAPAATIDHIIDSIMNIVPASQQWTFAISSDWKL